MVLRRTARVGPVVVLALLLTWIGVAVATAFATSPGQAETEFASRIGEERLDRGIESLAFAGDLQQVARQHAQRMADRGEPYHNPDLGSEVQGWDVVSENVGVGTSVQQIHKAFMDSTTHRDVILSREVTQLGVGAVVGDDGQVWVVEIFRRPTAASAPTSPEPATAATPATLPRSTPPTTAPVVPTTVTTAPEAPPAPQPVVIAEASPGVFPRALTAAAAARSLPLPEAPGEVPGAAYLAAFLLAAVVGFQGISLRRMGLVSV